MSTTKLAPVQLPADAQVSIDGSDLSPDQDYAENQQARVGRSSLPRARVAPKPRDAALGASLSPDQTSREAQACTVGRSSLPPANRVAQSILGSLGVPPSADHSKRDLPNPAVGGQLIPPAKRRPKPTETALGASLAAGHESSDLHLKRVGGLLTTELQVYAALLDDIEGVRIATENRLRQLEGFPVYAAQLHALRDMEHQVTLALQRAIRKHPLGPWIKNTVGIGEKQGARLIAALDDPAYNFAEGRPRRGPAELWAYCGFAPGQKRQKGVKSNWNAQAKMRAFLCAESCIKQRHSPFRATYDQARVNWADRDISDGHKHAHALRLTAKAILKDLFLYAKELT